MSNAEAWITGEYPNQKLNLKLPTGATGPQGPVGPIGPASTVPGPATELTVLDTVTGPETPGATGPQGLKGDKGDPGGITLGTLITGATDMNLLTTPGVYRWSGTSPINGPGPTFGVMYVDSVDNATRTIQRVYRSDQSGRVSYERSYTSSWQPWRSYSTTRVDQTAGRAIYQWDDLNNREQLVYGDTGWRNITPTLANGSVNYVHIRRLGSQVFLQVFDWVPGVGSATLITVDSPFRPLNHSYPLFIDANTSAPRGAFLNASSGVLSAMAGWTTTNYHGATLVWSTTAAWPTTLPGTAVGTIPNL